MTELTVPGTGEPSTPMSPILARSLTHSLAALTGWGVGYLCYRLYRNKTLGNTRPEHAGNPVSGEEEVVWGPV